MRRGFDAIEIGAAELRRRLRIGPTEALRREMKSGETHRASASIAEESRDTFGD